MDFGDIQILKNPMQEPVNSVDPYNSIWKYNLD